MKHTQTRQEEIKLSLFTDIMTLCIENAKGFTYTHTHTHTHKLLELINEFSKFVGYKINTRKSNGLLYPNEEQSEKETNKTILQNC